MLSPTEFAIYGAVLGLATALLAVLSRLSDAPGSWRSRPDVVRAVAVAVAATATTAGAGYGTGRVIEHNAESRADPAVVLAALCDPDAPSFSVAFSRVHNDLHEVLDALDSLVAQTPRRSDLLVERALYVGEPDLSLRAQLVVDVAAATGSSVPVGCRGQTGSAL